MYKYECLINVIYINRFQPEVRLAESSLKL